MKSNPTFDTIYGLDLFLQWPFNIFTLNGYCKIPFYLVVFIVSGGVHHSRTGLKIGLLHIGLPTT